MLDLVVRGGVVYDGSGAAPYAADVGIRGGRIVQLGSDIDVARRTIDVDGLAVAPGFIDNHTHFDAQLLWDPLATSSCYHGITTVITGNCGLSLAPCRPDTRDALVSTFVRAEAISRNVLEAGIDWSWESTGEYLRAFEGRLGVNMGALIGHCAVRHAVMGEDAVERQATSDEIVAMAQLVRDGMLAGAVGFSTQNNPRHMREDGKPMASSLADHAELDALLDVLGDLNCGVIQNIQEFSPDKDAVGRVAYLTDVAKRTGRPVLWQGMVHRWQTGDAWRELLAATTEAVRDGGAAIYPVTQAKPIEQRFTLTNAQCFDEFPTWRTMSLVPADQREQFLRDPAVRAKLRWEAIDDPAPSHFGKRWDLVWVYRAATEANRALDGLSITELAEKQGKDLLDAFLDLALEEGLETTYHRFATQGDPAAVAEMLKSPYVVVGQSDAGAHMAFDAKFGFSSTFLGTWVRDRELMPLEVGVRKLTFDIATIFGFADRGLLGVGYAADIAVFDPARINAAEPEWATDLPAGERRLIQRAEGVHHTIVNGVPIVEHGAAVVDARPGRVLRPASG